MRNSAFLALGVGLLLLQSNLFRLVSGLGINGLTPSLLLPLVIFMGVHEYSMVRGTLIAFVLGYLLDVFAGAPIGLYTFTSVALFATARMAGVRFAAQTAPTRVALVFSFSLLESVIVLILTAIFGGDPARPRALAAMVLPHAVSTALLAPLVFRLARRIHNVTVTVPRPEVARR